MEPSELGAWRPLLAGELEQPYFRALIDQIAAIEAQSEVYPPAALRMRAFRLTPPEAVRVVILGQDPYHEPGQANGLAFSVSEGVPLPPSLRNIFTELQSDTGCTCASGDLGAWARQGVLLLNTALTVTRGAAASHAKLGWERFTDRVIACCSELRQPVAFILWGAHAQKKAACIRESVYPRLVLRAAHPSPLSAYRGFFGSRPFSRVNLFLAENGQPPIDWSIQI